ncbi:MAG: hypothetical protein GEU73_06640 [Chloroflexi bacterium]|nr:hypothetical protein [Chloroflexota bacterium]
MLTPPRGGAFSIAAMCLGLAVLVAACLPARGNVAQPADTTPTPVTRAARTALALGTPTPLPVHPTAVIYADPVTGTPVWPTPPASCPVSGVGSERPDLGPSIGERPIWLAGTVLPVIPWRNEFLRAVFIVERGTEGELVVTGRRVDGDEVMRFIRPSAESVTDQLRVMAAGLVGAPTESPLAAGYADHQVFLVVPSPGCWELSARVGEHTRTLTIHIYN